MGKDSEGMGRVGEEEKFPRDKSFGFSSQEGTANRVTQGPGVPAPCANGFTFLDLAFLISTMGTPVGIG